MRSILLAFALLFTNNVISGDLKLDMKPGYWKNTVNFSKQSMEQLESSYNKEMQAAMEEMKKQFEAMTPEQKKMMESVMAAQGIEIKNGSIEMPSVGLSINKEGITSKSCVTEEDIKSGSMGEVDDPNCQTAIKQRSENQFHFTQVCQGDSPSTVDANIRFEDPKHYSGNGKLTQTLEGKKIELDVNLKGVWLAGTCR